MKKLQKTVIAALAAAAVATAGAAGVYAMVGAQQEASAVRAFDAAIDGAAQSAKAAEDDGLLTQGISLVAEGENAGYSEAYSFASFVQIYQPSQEEQAYLAKLLQEGISLDNVISLYVFWLDTDEPLAMIASLKEHIPDDASKSKNWLENAYNKVTANKIGILESDDVESYLAQNLTIADMKNANILARKGTKTIFEILDLRALGKTWFEIVQTVYQGVTARPADFTDTQDFAGLDDWQLIKDAIFVSQRTQASLAQILTAAQADEDLNVFGEYVEARTGTIPNLLAAQSLQPPVDEEKAQNDAAFLEEAAQNGLTAKEIESLAQSGLAPVEIANISAQHESTGTPVDQLAEEEVAKHE